MTNIIRRARSESVMEAEPYLIARGGKKAEKLNRNSADSSCRLEKYRNLKNDSRVDRAQYAAVPALPQDRQNSDPFSGGIVICNEK